MTNDKKVELKRPEMYTKCEDYFDCRGCPLEHDNDCCQQLDVYNKTVVKCTAYHNQEIAALNREIDNLTFKVGVEVGKFAGLKASIKDVGLSAANLETLMFKMIGEHNYTPTLFEYSKAIHSAQEAKIRDVLEGK